MSTLAVKVEFEVFDCFTNKREWPKWTLLV